MQFVKRRGDLATDQVRTPGSRRTSNVHRLANFASSRLVEQYQIVTVSRAASFMPGVRGRVPEKNHRCIGSGSFADIRADTQWLAQQGVTEVFYELN